MKANYNVTGNGRKALVAAIENLTGDKAIYMRMPTCAYEIGDITVTKGSAVKALAESLAILQAETAAIGDNTLDQDMIEWAGVGCCVDNGKEAVKEVADMILPAQAEEGVAWFLENYVLRGQA